MAMKASAGLCGVGAKVGLTEWWIKEKRGIHIKWKECAKKRRKAGLVWGKDVM